MRAAFEKNNLRLIKREKNRVFKTYLEKIKARGTKGLFKAASLSTPNKMVFFPGKTEENRQTIVKRNLTRRNGDCIKQ